jgi:hypothetical protein
VPKLTLKPQKESTNPPSLHKLISLAKQVNISQYPLLALITILRAVVFNLLLSLVLVPLWVLITKHFMNPSR